MTCSKRLNLRASRLEVTEAGTWVYVRPDGWFDKVWLLFMAVPSWYLPGDWGVTTTVLAKIPLYSTGGEHAVSGRQIMARGLDQIVEVPPGYDLYYGFAVHGVACSFGCADAPVSQLTDYWYTSGEIPPDCFRQRESQSEPVYGFIRFYPDSDFILQFLSTVPSAIGYEIPRFDDGGPQMLVILDTNPGASPYAHSEHTLTRLDTDGQLATGTTARIDFRGTPSFSLGDLSFNLGGDGIHAEARKDDYRIAWSLSQDASSWTCDAWLHNCTHGCGGDTGTVDTDPKWRRVSLYNSPPCDPYCQTMPGPPDYLVFSGTGGASSGQINICSRPIILVDGCTFSAQHYKVGLGARPATFAPFHVVSGGALTIYTQAVGQDYPNRPTYLRFGDLDGLRGAQFLLSGGHQDLTIQMEGLTGSEAAEKAAEVINDCVGRLSDMIDAVQADDARLCRSISVANVFSPLGAATPSEEVAQAFADLGTAWFNLCAAKAVPFVDLAPIVAAHPEYIDLGAGEGMELTEEGGDVVLTWLGSQLRNEDDCQVDYANTFTAGPLAFLLVEFDQPLAPGSVSARGWICGTAILADGVVTDAHSVLFEITGGTPGDTVTYTDPSMDLKDINGDAVPAFFGTTVFSDISKFLDMNCDGVFDARDIAPFVLALIDPGAYVQQYPGCDIMLGDVNRDGLLDNADVQLFVRALLGG